MVVGCWIKIGSHDDGILDDHIFPNVRPHPDHRFLDNRTGADKATVCNQTVTDGAGRHACRGQKAWSRENGRAAIRKQERRIGISQRQIAVIEGFDRSDVFPIAIEKMRLHMMVFNRHRKNVLAEIVMACRFQ